MELLAKAVAMKTRKNNRNNSIQNGTITSHQQPKIEFIIINNNNRSLIVGFANFGKTYLLNYILFQN